jgi:hypothetical protein
VPVDELSYDDFTLDEYDPAEGISFSVAEWTSYLAILFLMV